MAAWDKDTVAAKVALDLFRSDLAKKYPDVAEEVVTPELVDASIQMAKVKNVTAPPDPRFPAQNVSQYCWAKFNTYIMCMNHFEGAEQARCHTHKRHYLAMCPAEWVENFTSNIADGRWAGVQPKDSELFE